MRKYCTRGARCLAALAGIAVLCGAGAQLALGATEPARVGEWRFDETGGQQAVDTGPNGLDGWLGPVGPARVAGVSGGALRFDGRSFVRLPNRSALDVQTLTAEAVVRAPSSPGQWRYVLSRGGYACYASSYGLYTGAAGGIAVYVFDGSRYTVSATARPADVWDGRWHHVAGTFDGRSLRLFVDGRPVGQPIESPIKIDYATVSSGAYIGKYVGGCDLEFRGDIDLVRLWSGAHSADATAAMAAHELTGGGVDRLPGAGRPLPAAAPATIIPADRGPSARAPEAMRACVLRVSSNRVKQTRRAAVRVRVKLRGRPSRAIRVIAKRPGRARILARARTRSNGWARLVFDGRNLRRVRVSAPKTAGCAPVRVRVSAAR